MYRTRNGCQQYTVLASGNFHCYTLVSSSAATTTVNESQSTAAVAVSQEPLVTMVDLLAVNPGFAGQIFNSKILSKIHMLTQEFPALRHVAVDGGINAHTATAAVKAGATMIIAGSAIFNQNDNKNDNREENSTNRSRSRRRCISDNYLELLDAAAAATTAGI